MLAVHKEYNKVWIDLKPFYLPKHQHPNTVFKSATIVLKVMDSEVTYEQLMGISGAAFHIQFHEKWISELLYESKIKRLSKNGQPELSNQNAHIYYSLLDVRQCAA